MLYFNEARNDWMTVASAEQAEQHEAQSRQMSMPTPHHSAFYRRDGFSDTEPISVKVLKTILIL